MPGATHRALCCLNLDSRQSGRAGLASEARTRLRLGKGGYRREHVRAFAQHAEIADDAIYIKVSKKHPIEHADSHQRREVGWNRRSRFLPKWRTG